VAAGDAARGRRGQGVPKSGWLNLGADLPALAAVHCLSGGRWTEGGDPDAVAALRAAGIAAPPPLDPAALVEGRGGELRAVAGAEPRAGAGLSALESGVPQRSRTMPAAGARSGGEGTTAVSRVERADRAARAMAKKLREVPQRGPEQSLGARLCGRFCHLSQAPPPPPLFALLLEGRRPSENPLSHCVTDLSGMHAPCHDV